jgi:CDP-2,3-bis-(O-geranylgeranyl)-sn-glycerol synthase
MRFHLWPIFQGLVIVLAANGAPLLAKKIFGTIAAQPLDFGALFPDGRPIFGPSKTIRGVVFSVAAAMGAGLILGLAWNVGALAGAGAMAGDSFSSFIKRRLALPPESRALGLDQAPEAIFALLACKGALGLGAGDLVLATALFLIGEIVGSPLLFALKIRDRPY